MHVHTFRNNDESQQWFPSISLSQVSRTDSRVWIKNKKQFNYLLLPKIRIIRRNDRRRIFRSRWIIDTNVSRISRQKPRFTFGRREICRSGWKRAARISWRRGYRNRRYTFVSERNREITLILNFRFSFYFIFFLSSCKRRDLIRCLFFAISLFILLFLSLPTEWPSSIFVIHYRSSIISKRLSLNKNPSVSNLDIENNQSRIYIRDEWISGRPSESLLG